ncbi:cupin domain-containing protein [Pontixanthobacter aestiaquae]|uniref:Cupin domain-containing protein n=1 Tax=Pontixanthobacter aestiaquae TaxID=1509367 RepID=A0A844Z0C6_9SPHN|nr:cupin domain-containing protein [Pontixanthobacter aestiaquae]MDN3646837.1 cupin domain-containing protein [Pontixanthobacter aestiaquae]MXO82181.1 cupin domain-containing protein [Pontixanthobacter aestiaquae]
MELTGLDHTAFLRDYWQKKPLLIRNPWSAWQNPMTPEELAGLACEDTIESRLIIGGEHVPRVEHGPIVSDRYDTLEKRNWTLLVQAVDHHVPEVAALIEPFRFVPDWRIDDVMVSFAADGGGVGAHFDQYDVFLIQGAGKRRWQVGGMCGGASKLLPHGDLRLLADFTPTQEWVLEPGDMLYVPPGIAHNGIAEGEDCMTYSVGFRAPSRGDLIGGWMDDLLGEMVEDDRYSDQDLVPQGNPGEIAPEAIEQLHAMVTERLSDRSAFANWFGRYSSTAKYPEVDWQLETPITETEFAAEFVAGITLLRNPASRFAFIEQDSGKVQLFVQGEFYTCDGEVAEFARLLCSASTISPTFNMIASAAVSELTLQLIKAGSLAIEA